MSTKNQWFIRVFFIIYVLWMNFFSYYFHFMVLNSILAYIPIELSFHMNKQRGKLSFSLLGMIWLLFYPNTPYLFTDLLHLKALNSYTNVYSLLNEDITVWYPFVCLLLGVIIFGFLGFWSLDHVSTQISTRFYHGNRKKLFSFAVVALLTVLSSIAIYIGRFLRLHSVYLFTEPMESIKKILNMWDGNTLKFVLVLSILQFALFFLYRFIGKIQKNT